MICIGLVSWAGHPHRCWVGILFPWVPSRLGTGERHKENIDEVMDPGLKAKSAGAERQKIKEDNANAQKSQDRYLGMDVKMCCHFLEA